MQESEDGTVTGSIDASKLSEVEPKTDEAQAQHDQLLAEQKAAQEQAESDAEQASQGLDAQQGVETPTDDNPNTTEAGVVASDQDVNAETRDDGVYDLGGGWYEVVANGQLVDKVRGSEAAQQLYDNQQG